MYLKERMSGKLDGKGVEEAGHRLGRRGVGSPAKAWRSRVVGLGVEEPIVWIPCYAMVDYMS
jgi:hypothetical protein